MAETEPTPTRLRVLRGEWRPNLMMPEPQAEAGEVPIPQDLPPYRSPGLGGSRT